MMAQAVPNPPSTNERKRVKVYELRNNDWFDRGTGFCTTSFVFNEATRREDPTVIVQSEDAQDRMLLETKVIKEDGFQKQQDTLIVWTEAATMIDMALSFQESDGCAAIWKFVNSVQQQLTHTSGPEDALSDDIPFPITLPVPSLGNLQDVEVNIRGHTNTQSGRDALGKFILNEEYLKRLIPLVDMAEDLEDLPSLHRLCSIMKNLILLNDTQIIEYAVTDEVVLGVVGALEYDPDFPSHKANHRHWLGKEGRYKEVVRIDDDQIRKKIHQTYRLQYLKDVVLARILDDPTFSVLNSLIFFNQVDIVTHLLTNGPFLKELFAIFSPQEESQERKKEAVLFIQQCCAIAKNLQTPARKQLYDNFLTHGLLSVINFALRHSDVGVRVGATDVLVSMIDHDPQMVRHTIYRQMTEKQTPLTDSLIDLLLVESDLGVKSQIADAIKVLLDPGPQNNGPNEMGRGENGTIAGRMRPQSDPQQEEVVKEFYEDSAKRLFKPLVDLKDRESMDFSVHEVSLFIYLIEILCFFVRQHTHRSKHFVLSQLLGERIAQLLSSSEKYLKLTALKFFRNLIGLQDEFYNQQMMQNRLFHPILKIVIQTMPRDNLLNSACLEFFDFIRDKDIKPLIVHLVEHYREELKEITYVDTFQYFVLRYDQTQGFAPSMGSSLPDTDQDTPKRPEKGRGNRWESGIKDLDAEEEQYFNTSDDEDEGHSFPAIIKESGLTGPYFPVDAPASKPLVDYTSDEENESMEADLSAGIQPTNGHAPESPESSGTENDPIHTPTSSAGPSPPERLSEKRRREEDEEDELGKLAQQHKRRSSSASVGSNTSGIVRRKSSFSQGAQNGKTGKPNKIAISLSPAIKTGGAGKGGEDET